MRPLFHPAIEDVTVEGILHAGNVLPEGPLGEFTGYYGRERSPQPYMEIKAAMPGKIARSE